MRAGVEADVVNVRTEVLVPPAVKGTGLTLTEVVSPATGLDVDEARFTLPVKLLALVMVMADVPEPPATKLAGVAVPAEMPKS